ncbi:hypothetical protein ACSNOK_22420 [Streptomyces sp. URMC 126]|uniref:hypothetical protein n=1 Tax=Streptomyces sp. URMC 126 TaxID=3423401 RepID=UPI003F1B5301
MAYSSARILEALGTFAPVAWVRISANKNDFEGRLQIPYASWRFATPREGLAEVFRELVSRDPRRIAWTFDDSRRNWLLTPTRLLSDEGRANDSDYLDTAVRISRTDQRFCAEAAADMADIFESIHSRGKDSHERVLHMLHVLALDAQRQIDYARQMRATIGSLALRFHDALRSAPAASMTDESRNRLAAALSPVEEQLRRMTETGAPLWKESGVRTAPEWAALRERARKALIELGCEP